MENMRIAYIGGTFDLFHIGHFKLLQKAYEEYDRMVIAVNTDEFSEQFKRKPVMTLKERMEMLQSVTPEDVLVIPNIGGKDTGTTIEQLVEPTMAEGDSIFILHGDDWTGESFKEQLGITDEWMKEHHVDVAYYPYTQGISTSEIIKRIYENNYNNSVNPTEGARDGV